VSHSPATTEVRKSNGWALRRPARWLTAFTVLLLIVAGMIVGLGVRNRMVVQSAAVKSIQEAGGVASYASDTEISEFTSRPAYKVGCYQAAPCPCESYSTSLIRRVLGDRYRDAWDPVIAVVLAGRSIPRTASARFKHLTTIRWLLLWSSEIDRNHLSDLLTSSHELEWLFVDGTKFDDSHLQSLQHCQRLKWLSAGRTNISDTGVESLETLQMLRTLSLSDTAVSNAGLRHVGRLVGLTQLHLDGTQIDDQGIASLIALVDLERLTLRNTAVTNDGLQQLASLPNLQCLDVSGTSITDAGIEEFRRKRPSVVLFCACRER
jgi:hypothetical protein